MSDLKTKYREMIDDGSIDNLPVTPGRSNRSEPNLREAVRTLQPASRGFFASHADKTTLLEAIRASNTSELARVMQGWKAKYSAGTAVVDNPDDADDDSGDADDETATPDVGVYGKVPTGEFDPEYGPSEDLKKILDAAGGFNPSVATEIKGLVEAAMDTGPKFIERTVEIDSSGQTVMLAGVSMPVITDPAVDNPFIPAKNPSFNYAYWRAARDCGAVTFELSFGDAAKLVRDGVIVLLVGQPGTGKTEGIKQMCCDTRWPMTRFNGNQDVTMATFVGCYEARGGETVWIDGAVTRAMKEGHVLILDEVDHMPSECSSVLHAIMEPGGELVITDNGGEIVKPHPNFRIVATSNTAGFGDESGRHPAAQVQDAAFLSRFGAVFHVDWMLPENEIDLIRATSGLDEKTAEKIVKVANDTRRAVANDEMLYPMTLRQTLGWASLIETLGVGGAFAVAVVNKLPPQDVTAFTEIAQRHLGDTYCDINTPSVA